ncbi:hypothetical protein DPMN_050932 [Dreissena polymorpha]|uniref:Uncharacterized protein n=1 Tax=Dreissena polymorpha TaxID=45954 RepID=A0A9D4CHP1_DREPO|nr:hypothetical protein DPMN_050932 [Dreissena polymorpha]
MVPCDVTIVARDGTYQQQEMGKIMQENNFSSVTLQLRRELNYFALNVNVSAVRL